ncbi:MAG: hypothetical protein FJ295_19280 [Planctomycetes bacterium]|nr:hypothetical protein [Planctomycetota bacterium]
MKKQPHRGSLLLEATVAVGLAGAALLLLATMNAAVRGSQRDLNRRSAALQEATNILERARGPAAWTATWKAGPEEAAGEERRSVDSRPRKQVVNMAAGVPLIDLVPDARVEIVLDEESDPPGLERIQVTVYGCGKQGDEQILAELTGWRRKDRKELP